MTENGRRVDATALGALSDPARGRLFELVREHGEVGRDEAAQALGMARNTVAFHLDRLADVGLLAVTYRKPPGKAGPGSGRPAKRYTLAAAEVSASVPPRSYDLASEVMAAAIERAATTDAAIERALREAATTAGSEAAARRDPVEVLSEVGYQPCADDDGFAFANCPFHQLSRSHPSVVCAMNGAFLGGLLEHDDRFTVEPAEPGGPCCARLTRREAAAR
jgi:predicted ArsR family transcriptional regulator